MGWGGWGWYFAFPTKGGRGVGAGKGGGGGVGGRVGFAFATKPTKMPNKIGLRGKPEPPPPPTVLPACAPEIRLDFLVLVLCCVFSTNPSFELLQGGVLQTFNRNP